MHVNVKMFSEQLEYHNHTVSLSHLQDSCRKMFPWGLAEGDEELWFPNADDGNTWPHKELQKPFMFGCMPQTNMHVSNSIFINHGAIISFRYISSQYFHSVFV